MIKIICNLCKRKIDGDNHIEIRHRDSILDLCESCIEKLCGDKNKLLDFFSGFLKKSEETSEPCIKIRDTDDGTKWYMKISGLKFIKYEESV